MRKHCRRRVYSLVNPITHALTGAAVTPDRDLDKLRLLELSALESFRTGTATRADWRALADMVNLTEVMAVDFKLGGAEVAKAAEDAQAALLRVHARHQEGKPMLLDAPGLQALRDCYAWHDAQRTSVARSLYERAIKATADKIRGASPHVKVLA